MDVVNDYPGNVVPFWKRQGFLEKENRMLEWGKKSNAVVMKKDQLMGGDGLKNKHLPVFGVGPIYVIGCLILTILGIALGNTEFLRNGNIAKLKGIAIMAGMALIFMGVLLWIYAVVVQRISEEIKSGRLVTTGVYAIVRNPIYSAFFLIFSRALIMSHNVYLFLLPPVFYVSLTLLMKLTEEKWLLEKFGDDYRQYCNKVNRVIPWWRK